MAKFIKLTELRRNCPVALDIESIECMLPIPNDGGTELISVTHHTKYVVKETMDDILTRLDEAGMAIRDAKVTDHIMER